MPGSPGGPENPGNPVIPLMPLGPGSPGGPGEPLGPCGPGRPSGPGNPFWPGGPGGPGKPFSPFSPLAPSQKHWPLSLQTQPLPTPGAAATRSTSRRGRSSASSLGAVLGRMTLNPGHRTLTCKQESSGREEKSGRIFFKYQDLTMK